MKNKNNPFWFYVVLITIPFLCLFILEFSLRILGYGTDLGQWIKADENRLVLNPSIAAKYFSNIKDFPHSNNEAFDIIKDKNAFRIFVLGGSTTAGFPYSPNGGFSRYIKTRLEQTIPSKKIEVINLGLTAVNTYTVLDMIPGVLDQSPDLIILYTGHNEYYGALGIGSTETVGSSINLTNTYIYLSNYKTFQLVKVITQWMIRFWSSNKAEAIGETLMSRMVSKQTIGFKTDLYEKGVNQFQNNLDKILKLTSNKNIPVLIGTLTSNIGNQKPFVSTTYKNQSANELFELGRLRIKENRFSEADSILTKAKDLDGLRFRAPSRFNNIIRNLAQKYNYPIVEINKGFSNLSPQHIVDSNLIIDHLHPNLKGYFLMGELFYKALIKNKLIPFKTSNHNFAGKQDSIVIANFPFSSLDSIASKYRINNLMNNWPFKKNNSKNIPQMPKTKISQLAYKIVFNNLNWRKAHQEAYRWYLSKGDYNNFAKEINVLLSQYPYKTDYYNFAAEKLLQKRKFNLALGFIEKKYKISPDAFSTKWMGNIALISKNYKSAIIYFLESLTFNSNDAQSIYNLGLSYYRIEDLINAKRYLETCLKINPNYKKANILLKQINAKFAD